MIQKWSRTIGGVVIGLFVGALAFAGIVQAAPEGAPLLAPVGTAFTYQGFITDNGSPANGNHNLRFELHDNASTDSQVGPTVTKNSVAVSDGYFTVELDFGDVFNGTALWLAIEVQGPGDPGFTTLSPRQALNAAPFALYALNIPVHNHFGQTWSGTATYGLRVTNNGTSGARYGIYGETSSPDGFGVRGYSDASSGDSPGVYGSSPVSPDGQGVYGVGAYGIYGETWNPDGYAIGGFFRNSSTNGVALYATGSGSGYSKAAIRVHNSDGSKAAIRVHNSDGTGGVAASFTSLSVNETARFRNSSTGYVLYLQNGGDAGGAGGGDFIRAVNDAENDVQFRVTSAGNVYADGGYRCGQNINDTLLLPGTAIGQSEASIDPCLRDSSPADFAEMLPAQGSPEPGDVLAIGPDGYLTQSSEAYQTTIIGVYSFRPSFLGNAQFADEEGYVPLAMLGIVPVKVSAENGAIQPGDLLVASSTPGHAMKASENPPQGSVIGKALEPLTEGTGFIRMIVTLQ